MHATADDGSAMRWAARYAFCDALWRGRARLLVDAELEAILRAVVEDRAPADAPWRTLLEALVPRERSVATWMVVGSEPTARLLAPYFAGVRFIPADAIDDRFARLPWETALVTLDLRGEAASVATAPARLGVTTRTVETILVDVAAACGPGRIAVVAAMGPQLDYEGFVEQLRPTFGEVRVYGGYAPSMIAFAEFASDADAIAGQFDTGDDDPDTFRVPPPLQPRAWEDDPWDEGDTPQDDEDAVPLVFDNTLGPATPAYGVWIGVVGASVEFGEGLTLVELPPVEGGAATAGTEASAALRTQLQETRKVAELGALERQRLVERVDAALAENAGLRDAVAQLREQLAGALDPAVGGERLDAALAREQALRWRVAALEREVAQLRIQPVDELTAELEALRARLETVGAQRAQARTTAPEPAAPEPAGPRTATNPDAARRLGSRRPGSGRTAALRVVEALVRRIDRGQVERGSLRRELVALRRRLRG